MASKGKHSIQVIDFEKLTPPVSKAARYKAKCVNCGRNHYESVPFYGFVCKPCGFENDGIHSVAVPTQARPGYPIKPADEF